LPHDNGTYKQAPYQAITETDYRQWAAEMPQSIDWTWLSDYEVEDTTSGSQTLACVAGNCDVVSVGSVPDVN
jgi:ribonucleoside-diphosphate reductase alpha chain